MRSVARTLAVLGLIAFGAGVLVWFLEHDWGLWLGALGAVICASGAIANGFARRRQPDN